MGEKVKSIAVTGFYGQDNFGDDLFEYIFNEELKRSGVKVSCYGAGPLKAGSRGDCGFMGRRAYGRHVWIDKLLRLATMINMVLTADLIVYGGGSVFGKYASFKQRWFVSTLAKVMRKKLWAIGVSVGPFESETQQEAYVKVLKRFDKIVVRDNASFEVLSKSSISADKYKLLPDIAFLTPKVLKKELLFEEFYEDCLVLAVHQRQYINDIVELLKGQAHRYRKILIVSLERKNNDVALELFERVRAYVEGKGDILLYRGPSDFVRFCHILGSASYVVTSKLHGSIVAASYGVPFYLFCYQEKCSDLVDMLDYGVFNKKMLDIDGLLEAKSALAGVFNELRLEDYGIKR